MQKHSLLVNLKKSYFHKNKFYFLHYIILAQKIKIKDKKIKVIKNWHELKLIKDKEIFLYFDNFYWQFI